MGFQVITSGDDDNVKGPVASSAALPTSGNSDGDIRETLDTKKLYAWDENTSAWVEVSGGGSSTPTEYDAGTSGSAITIDWTNGVNQFLLLTADCTITFTNWTVGQEYTLILEQDDGGGHTPTFLDVNFENSTDPTWASNARTYTLLKIYYDGGGPAVTAFGPYVDTRYFVPTQLANCELFIMSTVPSTLPSASDGVAQTQWLDLSPNAFTFQQTSGSAKPIYHASGFGTQNVPYLHFDGSAQYMQTTANAPAALTGNPAFTVFAVFQGDNTSQDQVVCGWGAGNGGSGHGAGVFGDPVNNQYDFAFGGATNATSNAPIGTSATLFTATKSAGAINATTGIRVNGVVKTVGGSASTPVIDANPYCIGIWANYTPEKFAGKLAALVVYSRVLTGTEIGKVEAYLNANLGIY